MTKFFKIKLPNGKYLAVSSGDDRDYPYEIYVGIIDEDGEWSQNLAVIMNDYHYENGICKYDNRISMDIYSDSNSDYATDEFKINFIE